MNKTRPQIARIVKPTTGISYNPSKIAHQELLNQVIEEEKWEIEAEIKELKRFNPDLYREEKPEPLKKADSDNEADE